MNSNQELWWQQAKSDHELFLLLLSQGVAQCHVLHQLQMVTEKIAKAYFWRSNSPPPRSHVGFVQFLKSLPVSNDRERVASIFGFKGLTHFKYSIRKISEIAYDLERLAPSLANNGPNPEYPWPHAQPQFAPIAYSFPAWEALTSGSGRDLMRIIRIAVNRFPDYADT